VWDRFWSCSEMSLSVFFSFPKWDGRSSGLGDGRRKGGGVIVEFVTVTGRSCRWGNTFKFEMKIRKKKPTPLRAVILRAWVVRSSRLVMMPVLQVLDAQIQGKWVGNIDVEYGRQKLYRWWARVSWFFFVQSRWKMILGCPRWCEGDWYIEMVLDFIDDRQTRDTKRRVVH
jgi:hypothetical protein